MNKTELEEKIKKHFKKIRSYYLKEADKVIEDDYENETEEEKNNALFNAESNVIQAFYTALKETERQTVSGFNDLLYHRTKYPTPWMKKDDQLMYRLTHKYKFVIPFLNYIYERNRKPIKEILDHSKKIVKEVYGNELYPVKDKEHYLAIFITNKNFYADVTKEIGIKQITIQKIIRLFVKNEIFLAIGNLGRERVYSDGYFVKNEQSKTGYRKIPFLTKEDHKKLFKSIGQEPFLM